MPTPECTPQCLEYGRFTLAGGFVIGGVLSALVVSLFWSLTLLVLRRRNK